MSSLLSEVHPELVKEWSDKNLPLTPDKITFGSNKVVWWKGTCGHEWQTSVKARSGGENCPICSGARVIEGINDLVTLKPELADEWSSKNDPLKPTMVTIGSHKKVIWQDKYGHEWTATVRSRAISGTGCPYCSHNKILVGFNDFATTHPQLAKEWSDRNLPLMPDMVNEKSRRNVWWKCKECGYEWQSVVYARIRGTLCPVCADRKVMAGYNDLATTDAYLLSEWDYEKNKDISPNQVSRNSMRSVWWKCPLGHSWKAKVSERAIEGKGCKVCEDEYLSVLPQLAVGYYASKKRLRVAVNSDEAIGIPLETYIPDERLAIESYNQSEEIENLKKYICEKQGIKLIKVPFKASNGEIEYLHKIRMVFQSVHIYIASDVAEDTVFIRKRFYDWRKSR